MDVTWHLRNVRSDNYYITYPHNQPYGDFVILFSQMKKLRVEVNLLLIYITLDLYQKQMLKNALLFAQTLVLCLLLEVLEYQCF